ncbi:COPII coat assembly protein SEC16, partial [Lecanoromycetidae sp. Uapishka_2]
MENDRNEEVNVDPGDSGPGRAGLTGFQHAPEQVAEKAQEEVTSSYVKGIASAGTLSEPDFTEGVFGDDEEIDKAFELESTTLGPGSISRTNSFPSVPHIGNSLAIPPHSLPHSQVEDIMEENENINGTGYEHSSDPFSATSGDGLAPRDPFESIRGEEDEDFFVNRDIQTSVSALEVDEESRYEEGLPLMPSNPQHEQSTRSQSPIHATEAASFEEKEAGAEPFEKAGFEVQEDTHSFKPHPLNRKSTTQVLSSMHYAPHNTNHVEPKSIEERHSITKTSDGGNVLSTSTVKPQIFAEQQMDLVSPLPKEEDLAEMWKAALADDDLLEEDGTSMDPSGFFGDDDEGFLEGSDDQADDQGPQPASPPPIVEPVYGRDDRTQGFGNVPTGSASSQNRYMPAAAPQPQANPFASYNGVQQLHSTLGSQNPLSSHTGFQNIGQSPFAAEMSPSRPHMPASTQSFADKSKGGYTSPYDLPMDVTRPRKRATNQQSHPSSDAQIASTRLPPPRSSSMFTGAPTQIQSQPPLPIVPNTYGSGGAANVRPPAPKATPSAGSFFEELMPSSKPRPSSSVGRALPPTSQPPPALAPSVSSQVVPPGRSSIPQPVSSAPATSPSYQLLPPERMSIYDDEPPAKSPRQALPVTNPRPGEVKLQDASTLPLGEDIAAFPGPLKSKGKKKDVLEWLQKRITTLDSGASESPYSVNLPDPRKRHDEKILLWKIVKVIVEHDGVIDGSPSVEKAVRVILSPDTFQGDSTNANFQSSNTTVMGITRRSGSNNIPDSVSVALLGADHLQRPSDYDRDLDSILLTEVYDFARTVLSPSSVATVSPHLQSYKLYHAMILAEYGHKSEAQQYCEVITSALNSTTKRSPYYHNPLLAALDNLVDRLRQAPRDSSGSWISKPSIDKVSGSLWAKFNQYVAGDESDAASTGSGRANEHHVGSADAGPFAGVTGDSPNLSRTPSSSDLYGSFAPGLGTSPSAATANPTNTRYAPAGLYTPKSSLEQPGRSSSELQRPMTSDSLRPALAHQQYQSRPTSSAGSHNEPYQSTPLASSYAPRSDSYLPTPPSQPEYMPVAPPNDLSSSLYPQQSYQPTPPLEPQQRQEEYQPQSSFGATDGYEPPSLADLPPSSTYEPPSYDPPTISSYDPPIHDTVASQASESPVEGKRKAKSFMDDDEDDFEARAAAMRKEEKARKDREAEEAFKRAAEADAQKDNVPALNSKKSGWFGGWLSSKKEVDVAPGTPNAPIKAKLGEQSSFYYDANLKRWIDKKNPDLTPAAAAPPPPPKGPPSRAVSAAGGPRPPTTSTPPVPPLPMATAIPSINSTGPDQPPLQSSRPPSQNHSRSQSPAVHQSENQPTETRSVSMPMATGPPSGPPSAPPSRPGTGMSGASNIDDLIGAPQARKGGTIRKAKKGRGYVDVMAK